jgi:hypothetical protein
MMLGGKNATLEGKEGSCGHSELIFSTGETTFAPLPKPSAHTPPNTCCVCHAIGLSFQGLLSRPNKTSIKKDLQASIK